jgi:hypothetical protein
VAREASNNVRVVVLILVLGTTDFHPHQEDVGNFLVLADTDALKNLNDFVELVLGVLVVAIILELEFRLFESHDD